MEGVWSGYARLVLRIMYTLETEKVFHTTIRGNHYIFVAAIGHPSFHSSVGGYYRELSTWGVYKTIVQNHRYS